MQLQNHVTVLVNYSDIAKQNDRLDKDQSTIITSDDSINSLTTYNNHYTLLYPDLVQELFNFALHNSNSTTNNSHFLRRIGVNNTKYSSLDSSLSSSLNSLLSPRDILFFLQIVSLYQLELSKGNTSITYPSLKLAKLLGVDASCDTTHLTANTHNSVNSLTDANMRAIILKMTAKLESLGLLKVFRSKRNNGMDKANKLVPVLPDRLYDRMKDSYTNLKVSDSSKSDHESNLEHILRTKLFVPIELEFMKSLFRNNLPFKYKLFFLNCIMSAYRNFRHNLCSSDILSFSATSRELMKKNDISRSTLDRIFRYVKQQGDNFFLKVEHKYTKSDDIDSNRYDKSIFVISINPLVFPIASTNLDKLKRLHEEELESGDMNDENCRNGRMSHDEFQDTNSPIFPDTYNGFKTAWSKKQPSIIKKTALNNKDIIIKESNKNIDANLNEKNEALEKLDENYQINPPTFLQISNSQYLESEQSSLSSKSLKNSIKDLIDALPPLSHTNSENASSTIEDVPRIINENLTKKNKINSENNFDILTSTKTASKPKASTDKVHKDFRHFYPISSEDSKKLNCCAGREFDTNFTNQLLLKLYIKYPEKRFKNKFTFSDYMIKALKKEKHQGPLVNHTSFRFGCNIGTEEKNLLEYERYLNQIEDSLDLSKEMCVKKKIAGRFSTNVAYKILTGVEFKTNAYNSFITALIPSYLDLSERQIEILSQQLEAVYGINGYYVEIVTESKDLAKEQETSKASNQEMYTNTKECSMQQGMLFSAIPSTSAWHSIRQDLIAEFGKDIDNSWFSKALVTEAKETNLLTLTMPNKFMSDFIKSRYGYAISRISGTFGFKYIEYNC